MPRDDDDASARHLVLKAPLKRLICRKDHLQRIEDGVRALQRVADVALGFGKLLFLQRLDELVADTGGRFYTSVAAALTSEFPMTSSQIEEWLDVVSTDLSKRRGPPYHPERAERMRRLHSAYDVMAATGHFPVQKTALENLSVSKGALAEQLAVNFAVNVHCHYDKYVSRVVRQRLAASERQRLGLSADDRLSPDVEKQLRADVRAVVSDVLSVSPTLGCREPLRAIAREWQVELMPPRPPGTAPSDAHWRMKSQKDDPARWVPYMVVMDRWLEQAGSKLLSPIPQRSSFVPGHIHLDTNALVDLLVQTQVDAQLLRASVEATRMPQLQARQLGVRPPPTWKLTGLLTTNRQGVVTVNKAGFYKAIDKVVAGEQLGRVQTDPRMHTAELNTAVWRSLTMLGTTEHVPTTYMGLVFSNVVDTDGVSVSLHYVHPDIRGLTRFNGGAKELREGSRRQARAEKDAGSTYVTQLPADVRERLLRGSGKIAAADPGKGVLLTVTDGEKVVRYTSAQRRAESGAVRHRKQLRRELSRRCETDPNGRTFAQLQASLGGDGGACSKCCVTASYSAYLRARNAVRQALETFYARTAYRRRRYAAFLGRRSSEDRFCSRLEKAFGKDAVILYGDWGRTPNLRHQPPSPGIGLRRRLASRFEVYLVNEAYTSSRCPSCESAGLEHPRECRRRREPVHHLLRCPNRRCSSPWWHRDVLGALNIRKNGCTALRTGRWHEHFSSRSASS